MTLRDLELLFVDCQTTGIRPPNAHLLEIAWGIAKPDDEIEVHSHLVKLPDGHAIPRLVSEMTGLGADDLEAALERTEVGERLRALNAATAVIHYAQFEKPFLLDLLGHVPFEIFCTHQLAKRLFPKLPSRNIRATAGFFGPPVLGHNRAATFVRATAQIWRGLRTELENRGVTELSGIRALLEPAPPKARGAKKPSTGYEYRLDKIKRLGLPDQPGVYRMLGQTGEVLYVGKATSLRSRVNSYFRGKKGRDARKLEMIAQVWDLDVTATGSPLEAALLESDEIKRLNPPYNVMLRTGRRHLVFYARDFNRLDLAQSGEFPIGPFRDHNWIEHLRALTRSLARQRFEPIFFDEIPAEDLAAGFELFCEQQNLEPSRLITTRAQLALGLSLYRRFADPESEVREDAEDDESASSDEPRALTIEEVAGKYDRLFRRAGRELWRSRRLTRLLDARVEVSGRPLTFRRGRLVLPGVETEDVPVATSVSSTAPGDPSAPWHGLNVDTFDRMSILLSELTKRALTRPG
jgi:DNA polymerase-3 subunit epsilon